MTAVISIILRGPLAFLLLSVLIVNVETAIPCMQLIAIRNISKDASHIFFLSCLPMSAGEVKQFKIEIVYFTLFLTGRKRLESLNVVIFWAGLFKS